MGGLKQCEDVLDNGNDITAVTFMLKVEGPGTGNLPDECTELRTSMKTIKGKVSLILSISEHNDIEIIRCFLNGIRREMLIEPESLKSILFITEKPWRNRRFSIENRIDDYLEEDDNIDMEKDNSEDEGEIDKKSERTNSKGDTRKERYFIYKKGTKTYREAIPFKDSIMREDEVRDETTDDLRKEEKLKENMSQENILGASNRMETIDPLEV